jgi:drug/metabolite transporter (DMT)-like permease
VLGTVIALPLAMKGQSVIAPGIAASLLATTPIFALPISVFALREPIGPASLAGTVLAVAGVALLS